MMFGGNSGQAPVSAILAYVGDFMTSYRHFVILILSNLKKYFHL